MFLKFDLLQVQCPKFALTESNFRIQNPKWTFGLFQKGFTWIGLARALSLTNNGF